MLYTITFSANHPWKEQAGKTFELFRISGDVNQLGDWVWFRNDDHGTWWGWDSPRMGAVARVLACGKEDTPNLGQLHEAYRVEEVGGETEFEYFRGGPEELPFEIRLELGTPELEVVEEDDPDEE